MARKAGNPLRLWVAIDEFGEALVSFAPIKNARIVQVALPADEKTLLEIFSAVATTIRSAADVDNNRDAVRILQARTLDQQGQPEQDVPIVREVKDPKRSWRREPARNTDTEYPSETTSSVRARPAGQPDSNRRRH